MSARKPQSATLTPVRRLQCGSAFLVVGVLSPFPILIACARCAHDANVITAPELSRSKAPNAYAAIQQIRPEMLRTRTRHHRVLQGPPARCRRGLHPRRRRRSATNPSHWQGGPDRIRQLLDGGQRFGTGFGDGVMLIETRADSVPEFAAWSEQLPLRAGCIREELAARAIRQAPTSAWAPLLPGPPQLDSAEYPEAHAELRRFRWQKRHSGSAPVGRLREALAEARHARELDPLGVLINVNGVMAPGQ